MTKFTRTYSLWTGFKKSLFRTIIFAGPLVLGLLPEVWMNVTLGVAIGSLINYAKYYDLHEEVTVK